MDKLERAFLLGGTVAAAVLLVLTVLAYRDYRNSRPSVGVAAAVTGKSSSSSTSYGASTTSPPSPPIRTSPPPPAPAAAERGVGAASRAAKPRRRRGTTLVLKASRGDSWVEVHAGSQSGQTLYASTLTQGKSMKATSKSLWLRIGAPVELDATLNGKTVKLPSVTATVQAKGTRLTTLAVG